MEQKINEKEQESAWAPVQKRQFPSWIDLFVLLGLFLVANLVGSGVALLCGIPMPSSLPAAQSDLTLRLAMEIDIAKFNAVSYFVAMLITCVGFYLYRWKRCKARSLGRFSWRGFNPSLLLWGVLFMLTTSLVIEPLLLLLPAGPEVYGRGLWAIVTVVVMAPIFEEVLFRGILLESLRARYGVVAALMLSSLLFAVIHFHLTVAVNAFFMGLILGYIYLETNSLWSVIFLHALNNTISYVLMALGYASLSMKELVGSPALYWALYGGSVVVLVLSAWKLVRTLRTLRRAEKKAPEAQ